MLGYHALCWPPAAQQGGGTGAGEEMGLPVQCVLKRPPRVLRQWGLPMQLDCTRCPPIRICKDLGMATPRAQERPG